MNSRQTADAPARRGGATTTPREIARGIWWLPQCLALSLDGQETHLHVSSYLILGKDRTLLWDGGTHELWHGLDRLLDSLLGDRPLDYLVPSHAELAHCANLGSILDKYPTCQVLGDVRDYPFYFPGHADRLKSCSIGDELDLGGMRFVFVDAVLKDLPTTLWGYEASQQVLFVADGFAYSHRAPIEGEERPPHLKGECSLLASELGGAPGPEQVVWITKAALYWTHFLNLDAFRPRMESVLRDHPTRLVAPAHGPVIDNVDEILWPIWDALSLAYDPGRGVALAGVSHEDRTPT